MSHHASRITHHGAPAKQIVPALLHWFAANARDLPWRHTRDPYAIWVSEIMLQQTQVKTVIPYWERWMRELPTIQSLATAKPERIHKLWEGLGYYTRVRNLQKAAQQIVAQPSVGRRRGDESPTEFPLSRFPLSAFQSETPHVVTYQFPDNFDAILALPGIGRYTAGAIASIAFNQPAPILDGNVIRVLARLHGIAEDPQEKQTNARLWQLAEELVHTAAEITQHATRNTHEGIKSKITIKIKNPAAPPCSALNQSLMELGALICTPRTPNCPACPVAQHCIALRENRVEELPRPKQRAATTARRFLAFIIERNGRFLVQQRADGIVNAHLWEFPNIEIGAQGSSPAARPQANALRLTKPRSGSVAEIVAHTFGNQPASVQLLCVVKHSITRYRLTTEAYRVSFGGTSHTRPKSAGVWRTLAQLHKLPFTSAHRRIATRLGNP